MLRHEMHLSDEWVAKLPEMRENPLKSTALQDSQPEKCCVIAAVLWHR